MLNGTPVKFRSSTQKTVALLVTKVELYAAIMTAQDMMYVLHKLKSTGLNAHLGTFFLTVSTGGHLGYV